MLLTPPRSEQIPQAAMSFVREIDRLVTFPDVWMHINRHIESDADAATIAKAVEMDTDLSARVLRSVNSPCYMLACPVETISRAVTILGIGDLRDLAFLTVARRLFTGIPSDIMDLHKFWSDALRTGIYAALLGRYCHMLHPERAYIMGMIHNIGLLALCRYLPEKEREALLIADGDETVLPFAEQELLGFSHAQIGAALLQHWHLPDTLTEVALLHHSPEDAWNSPLDVAVVHVATLLTNGVNRGLSYADIMSQINPAVAALINLDETGLQALDEQGNAQLQAMTQAHQIGDAHR